MSSPLIVAADGDVIISAVIFDMDGLLFDTESGGRRAWAEAMVAQGYMLTDAIYSEFIGRDMAHREQVLKRYFGTDFPFARIKAQRIAEGDAQETREGLPLKPGVRHLLALLATKCAPVALATGTARERVLRRLDQAGITDHFRTIVTSEDVVRGKPSPDIFVEAARRLRVLPAQCLVFEDSCVGVAAAAQAGMRTVMVPDLEPPAACCHAQAWRIISTLEAAPAFLR